MTTQFVKGPELVDPIPDHEGVHKWTVICDWLPRCTPAHSPYRHVNFEGGPLTYDPPPSHYKGDGLTPWEVVDAFDLDYYTGNVLKYLLRAGKKDIAPRLDDLIKARNYINKAIEMEEAKS